MPENTSDQLGTQVARATFHTGANIHIGVFAGVLLSNCIPAGLLFGFGVSWYLGFALQVFALIVYLFVLVELFVRLPSGSYRISLHEHGLRILAHGIRYADLYDITKIAIPDDQQEHDDDKSFVSLVFDAEGKQWHFYNQLPPGQDLDAFLERIGLARANPCAL